MFQVLICGFPLLLTWVLQEVSPGDILRMFDDIVLEHSNSEASTYNEDLVYKELLNQVHLLSVVGLLQADLHLRSSRFWILKAVWPWSNKLWLIWCVSFSRLAAIDCILVFTHLYFSEADDSLKHDRKEGASVDQLQICKRVQASDFYKLRSLPFSGLLWFPFYSLCVAAVGWSASLRICSAMCFLATKPLLRVCGYSCSSPYQCAMGGVFLHLKLLTF